MTFREKLRHKTVKTIYDDCKGTAFNEKCEIWKNNFLNYIKIKSESLLLVKNVILLNYFFLIKEKFILPSLIIYSTYYFLNLRENLNPFNCQKRIFLIRSTHNFQDFNFSKSLLQTAFR